jgi:hypothetical protein
VQREGGGVVREGLVQRGVVQRDYCAGVVVD